MKLATAPTLVACRTCKKEVAEEAVVCPHCGQPVPHPEEMNTGKLARVTPARIAGAVVVLVLGAVAVRLAYTGQIGAWLKSLGL